MTDAPENSKTEAASQGAAESVGSAGAEEVIRYQPSASWQLFRSIGRFAARAFMSLRRRP
jgi:hypothetical protein